MATLKLIKHVGIVGTIECLTGLRIGGAKEDIEIGGMDNPIIRDPRTRRPYIPGSSLKGKLRSALEYKYCGSKINSGQPCGCADDSCVVCRLFGPHRKPHHGLGPTRVLVRDARMDAAGEDPDRWVEVKSENMIDRRTGVATNPRPVERVVPGAKFAFEISVRIFEGDNADQLIATVKEGLGLIEAEYLGASGSRGYGKVRFDYTVLDPFGGRVAGPSAG